MDRIFIGGLTARQEQMIRDSFPTREFRFGSSDESVPAWLAAARGCTHMIVMSKFTSHSKISALKSANMSYIFANGGVSSLKELISQLN